jgi:hypothetical protein
LRAMIVEQAVTLCKRNHGTQTRIDLQEQMPLRLPRGFEEHTHTHTHIYIYIYTYIQFSLGLLKSRLICIRKLKWQRSVEIKMYDL